MGDMSREPSMEEILSSIRRVIARDEGAMTSSPPRAATLTVDEEEDVLELTNPSPVAETPVEVEEPVEAAASDEVELEEVTADTAIVSEPTLVSPDSAAASRHSLDALAALVAARGEDAAPAAPAISDISVNALVEAALRPMLKQWLDANLPAIVERMVAKEIARIADR